MNPCETHTLSQINFLLWLGFTYGVDYIVKHALRTLTLVFPSGRLEDWKPLRKTVKIVKLGMFEGEREDLAACINVLRKLRRMQNVLPVIFYAYCQLVPIAAIAAQYTEEKEEYHLSDEDLVTCLKAIPKLVEHKRKVLDAFTDKSIAANCEDENQCRAAFARIRKAMKGAESPDALEDLSAKYRTYKSWKLLCAACREQCETELQRRRLTVWQQLGEIFDIAEWSPEDNVNIEDSISSA